MDTRAHAPQPIEAQPSPTPARKRSEPVDEVRLFSPLLAIRELSAYAGSGATGVGRRAAQLLIEWSRAARRARSGTPPTLTDGSAPAALPPRGEGDSWRRAVESFALELALAQPSMAPSLMLANELFLALESARTASMTRAAVARTVEASARKFLRSVDRSLPAMRRNGGRLIRSGATIVSYSASGAVEEVLRGAHRRGRRIEVILSESRPAAEGTAMAVRLARAGVPVTLSTDAAIHSWLDGAALVLVGADAVSREGVINKIGTAVLAEVASSRQVPVAVVAGPEKFLPPALAAFLRDGERPGNEIYAGRVRGLSPSNRTFDLTPFERVSRFVTGWGLLAPEEVAALLSGLTCSARLQRMLVSRLGVPSAPKGRKRSAGGSATPRASARRKR